MLLVLAWEGDSQKLRKRSRRMMNRSKYTFFLALMLLSGGVVYAAVTPSPTDSRTLFGPRPLFAAGGATKVIVDDFGWIDYTLTDQARSIRRNSISDWKSQ